MIGEGDFGCFTDWAMMEEREEIATPPIGGSPRPNCRVCPPVVDQDSPDLRAGRWTVADGGRSYGRSFSPPARGPAINAPLKAGQAKINYRVNIDKIGGG